MKGERSTNARNVKRWINDWLDGKVSLQAHEKVSPDDRTREAALLCLRRISGIQVADFERQFGVSPIDLNNEVVAENIDRGRLELTNGMLRLTKKVVS